MGRLIAILNIVGSAASIVGLIATYQGIESPITQQWMQNLLWISLLLSAYVLLVPSNPLATNAEAKYKTFTPPISTDGAIHVQDGEFTMVGGGEQTIRFEVPFVAPPDIEIIDKVGCTGERFPEVIKTSQFSFTVRRTKGHYYASGRL